MTSEPILVLTTGGTIDKQYFDPLSEYQITESIIARLLEVACVRYPFRVEEIMRKDSLEIGEADRATLVERVLTVPEARVVITHGTDTMVNSAKTLESVFGKIIVLVGALTPARFAESDAAFNLGMAFATAQAATPGVYVTTSGSVLAAGSVVKDRKAGAFVPC